MKFGKLQDISQVDFSLPPIDIETPRVLATQARVKTKIYVGSTGWTTKEWIGKYYPPKTKSTNFLKEYGKHFNGIELNTTHYRIPDSKTIEKWYTETAADFKFSPKIPQSISHSNDLGGSNPALIQRFCESITGLNEKLGLSFMQLPPNFGPRQLPFLSHFLQAFPLEQVPLSIEFRAAEWFSDLAARQAAFQLLEEHGVCPVITDVAGRRDVLHLRLCNDKLMLRFVGNELHQTDYQRVDAWVEQLGQWLDKGLSEIYFFGHEPDNILSPEICAYFVRKMNQRYLRGLSGPEPWEDEQLSLF